MAANSVTALAHSAWPRSRSNAYDQISVATSVSEPNSALIARQPIGLSPKIRIPQAIKNLPSGGCS